MSLRQDVILTITLSPFILGDTILVVIVGITVSGIAHADTIDGIVSGGISVDTIGGIMPGGISVDIIDGILFGAATADTIDGIISA